MVPKRLRAPFDERPVARETAVAVVAVGAFVVWIQALWSLAYRVTSTVDPDALATTDLGELTATALSNRVVLLAGIAVFALAHARLRGLPVELSLPDRTDIPMVATAALVPVAGVAAVTVLASATGTTLAVLEGTYYAQDADPLLPATLTLLTLLVGLPAYVFVAHEAVQRPLSAAGRPWTAVAVTTLFVGAIGPREIVGTGLPARAAVVFLVLAACVALPAVAAHAFDYEWLPALCAIPLALFVGGVLVSRFGGADGLAEGALVFTGLAVVAVAAHGYERTGSLVVPAVAYAAFVVGIDAVAFAVGIGATP
ncbi:hypothetical protein [Halosimplex pelagicum]|uniref:Uncharacterized protein n=1 Tax=Halosimplex pelagicum TaxID=869886 RepID=A0A7D5PAJ3_9EURY|nr:hypothetical protein [Halosimplex pelagicum]QLH81825.1 hypothetical protein HZS54_09395 [Halosimplex pelagicum]